MRPFFKSAKVKFLLLDSFLYPIKAEAFMALLNGSLRYF
jgi:hypothetical protein